MLSKKTVVLGVTGSIAAYKAVDLASKLTQEGATVEVAMTPAATEFVSPLTFRAITGRPVVTDMFDSGAEFSIEHVALAERADVVVVAPATADIIARMAAGMADDTVCCTVLATKAPVIVAPAMHAGMYQNQVTQDNIRRLKARGFHIVGPAHGRLASGGVGPGRFVEVEELLAAIRQVLDKRADLAGRAVLVTAGGTQEPIDPVRFVGNHSSGKMGYAIAEAARDRGATVTLVAAPNSLPDPAGVKVVRVGRAVEMREAVLKAAAGKDVLIMAAAVADYQPKVVSESKIKKGAVSLNLELVMTPDILAEVKGIPIKVGFAAESENLLVNARAKLKQKDLDLIVANDITLPGSGFGSDNDRVSLIDKSGKAEELPLMSKREVAEKVLDRVEALLQRRRPSSRKRIG
ncbi:MAG: bifunctional phosphopantothenoylcysteine decarboxylase/phosphopantothenate--cysteine ligase CoaBC [Dehalococcoidia bacterium]|nr:bifunctional phosphopantothenoylcysteine decarboxylase/phosphopantothenate--cysteine ligase CoaBC [Dehalococcoidia bacterium]